MEMQHLFVTNEQNGLLPRPGQFKLNGGTPVVLSIFGFLEFLGSTFDTARRVKVGVQQTVFQLGSFL
jgi:hypothetical protein